jgi:hypothetical protein
VAAVRWRVRPRFQDRFNFHQYKKLLISAEIISLFAQVARFLLNYSANQFPEFLRLRVNADIPNGHPFESSTVPNPTAVGFRTVAMPLDPWFQCDGEATAAVGTDLIRCITNSCFLL